MVVIVLVLFVGIGTLSFADGVRTPIQHLADVSGMTVQEIKEKLSEKMNVKDLAESLGVFDIWSESVEKDFKVVVDELVKEGILTVEEGTLAYEVIEQRLSKDNIRNRYRELKKEYLSQIDYRVAIQRRAESLSSLIELSPREILEEVQKTSYRALAEKYNVLQEYIQLRKEENMKFIDMLVEEEVIIESEAEAFRTWINAYEVNQVKGVFDIIRERLKEKIDGKFSEYREIYVSPVEVYSELMDINLKEAKNQVKKRPLRWLVIENDLVDEMKKARVENAEIFIRQLWSDGYIDENEKKDMETKVNSDEKGMIRQVITEIKTILKEQ